MNPKIYVRTRLAIVPITTMTRNQSKEIKEDRRIVQYNVSNQES
jgi:hypothetical protein